MQIELIEQEAIADTDQVITMVTISHIQSSCILTRVMMDRLGRPGRDNDMEFFGGGDRWTIAWTNPKLSLEEVQQLMTQIINSGGVISQI